jgi:signal peptidase I
MNSEQAMESLFALEGPGLLERKLRASKGVCTFVCLGTSMEPALLAGDRLLLDNRDVELKVGWIVAFRYENSIVIHRVVRVNENAFWTRGDSLPCAEGPVPHSDFLARVVGFWRGGQYTKLDNRWRVAMGLLANLRGSCQARLIQNLAHRRLLSRMACRLVGGVSRVVPRLFGGTSFHTVRSEAIYLGILVANGFGLQQDLIRQVEGSRADVVVAEHFLFGRLGHVLMHRINEHQYYIVLAAVPLVMQALGVNAILLRKAINQTAHTERTQVFTSCTRNNVLAAEVLQSLGFRRSNEEIFVFGRSLHLPGRLVHVKEL